MRTPNAYLALFGSFARIGSVSWSPQATLSVATYTPTSAAGWLGEAGFSLGGSSHSDGATTGQLVATARLHWQRGAAGTWLGGAVGTTWTGESWLSFRAAEVGALVRRESVMLTLRAAPTATADDLQFTDLGAGLDGAVGIVDLGAFLGGRLGAELPITGGSQRVWGGASAAVWVAPRAAIVAAAGTYPLDPTQGFPAGEYVSVSLRLGGWRAVRLADAATARAVRRAARSAGIERIELLSDSGRLVLRVYAPGATRVEMMGDISQWSGRPLTRDGRGWWMIALEGVGATELVVRVDGGAWAIPPGAQVVTDEFGGRVGRVFVP